MRRIALAVSVSVLAATAPAVAVPAVAAPAPAVVAASPAAASVPGELVVGYDAGVGTAAASAVRARTGNRLVERVVAPQAGRRSVERVRIPAGTSQAEAIAALEAQPGVAYAEPNWILTKADASNDPSYTSGQLWGMGGNLTTPASTFGSQAAEAWATGATGSSSVYVGVIDEGIDVSHPDLAANVWQNPYDPVNGLDDDGNGYVDDTNGWDFVNNDRGVYDAGTDNHGTHVSGTIGGVGGNGIGVAGVNWKVTLLSGKFLGPTGGSLANAVKAIDYFTDLKVRHGLDIVATSNSWGGGGYSFAMQDAINRAAKADILFIAAAGNSGTNNDATAAYPSGYSSLVNGSAVSAVTYDNVVSVAAIDSAGGLASFSQYGATSVDLGAPGVSVLSTLPGATYGAYSGTSMATPHVSGAAALIAATYGLRGQALRTRLLQAVTPTASLAGKTATGGRLDLSLVSAVPLPPDTSAPTVAISSPASGAALSTSTTTTVTASASDDRGVASVQFWATPSGGSPVLLGTDTTVPFSVSWKPSAGGSWSLSAVATDTSTNTASSSAVTVSVTEAPTGLRVSGLTTVVSGTSIVVTATITNNLGAPVRSASVAVSLYRNGGATAYKKFTGSTSSTGVISWKASSVPTGCYSSKVTSVKSGSLVWDKVSPASVTSPCR